MKLNELDEAQLKHEFRQMYKSIGYKGALQVAYELMVSFSLILEVMDEETKDQWKH